MLSLNLDFRWSCSCFCLVTGLAHNQGEHFEYKYTVYTCNNNYYFITTICRLMLPKKE